MEDERYQYPPSTPRQKRRKLVLGAIVFVGLITLVTVVSYFMISWTMVPSDMNARLI